MFLQPGQAHQPGAGDQNAQGCTGKHAPGQLEAAQGCAAEWYTNYTAANPGQPGSWDGPIGKGEPTIARSSPLRTYQDWNFVSNKPCTLKDGPECTDWTAPNPWRAPVSCAEMPLSWHSLLLLSCRAAPVPQLSTGHGPGLVAMWRRRGQPRRLPLWCQDSGRVRRWWLRVRTRCKKFYVPRRREDQLEGWQRAVCRVGYHCESRRWLVRVATLSLGSFRAAYR